MSSKVTGAVLGSILGATIILLVIGCLIVRRCFSVKTPSGTFNWSDIQLTRKAPLSFNWFANNIKDANITDGANVDFEKAMAKDLEKQVPANDLTPTKPRPSTELEQFDRLTLGLSSSPNWVSDSCRMTSIQLRRNSRDQYESFVAHPPENEKKYLHGQFDSFSRTLILQNLIQDTINQGTSIRQVKDPFSSSPISVGGIVVVVKPFHGTHDYEFSSLMTGDLLKVIKFYIHDDSSCQGARYSWPRSNIMTNSDPNYSKVYCTGVKLNSFIEYKNNSLSLHTQDSDTSESELLMDFPLSVVSLQATLWEASRTSTKSEYVTGPSREEIDE